jgi:Sulfate permease family
MTDPRRHTVLPDWFLGYQKDWLRPDLIAGLTTAAVVIPKALAFATIAGLPVQVGLYTDGPTITPGKDPGGTRQRISTWRWRSQNTW